MAKSSRKVRISLKVKIVGLGITAIVMSIVAVALFAYFIASSALHQQAFNSLTAINQMKKIQIENFFKERGGDVQVLAENPFTRQAFRDLAAVFETGGASKGGNFKGLLNGKFIAPAEYRTVHAKYHSVFKHYMELYGYYDIFLMQVDDGDSIYTVTKEGDFGTMTSQVDSSLRDVWRIAVKESRVAISDTKPYAPSGDAPAQFIAFPIKEGGRTLGVLAFQISIEAINGIMKVREGMGKTGESYLVGKDLLMRSDSFLDAKNHTVAASFKNPDKGKVDTEAPKEALQGNSDTKIITDYNGNPVLSAYQPVKVGADVTWAMMSEIDEAEISEPVDLLRNWILGISAAILALASFIFFVVVKKNILNPVMMLRSVSTALANGDLTENVDYEADDEIGDLAVDFNSFIDSIRTMVGNIITSSQNLAQAVQQIASGNQTLSQRTSEQASSLEEIASTLEESTATINQNAENTGEASKLSDASRVMAEKGNSVVADAVGAINEINVSSTKISEITSVINEIAFQTNLLALNAAVEAARAGEQGRGFAVVAGEVRNLAQRSSTAAKEIEDLIKDSIEKIERGTALSNESGEALKEIMGSIDSVGKIVAEISTASLEQKQGMNQINTAVTEMDSMTQQNASLVEETASASEEMSNQASDLLAMVEQFKVDEGGLTSTVGAVKQKQVQHLHAADGQQAKPAPGAAPKEGNGNGKPKAAKTVAAPPTKGEGELSDMMKDEGFEEF